MTGLRISHYRLDENAGWHVDFKHLEQTLSPKTRAIVLISPHNPTGMVATPEELDRLADIAMPINCRSLWMRSLPLSFFKNKDIHGCSITGLR